MADQSAGAGKDTGSSTVKGINHVGMSVGDLRAAVEFYTNAVALEEEPSKTLSNPAAEKASGFDSRPLGRTTLRAPNGYLELSQYDASHSDSADVLPVCGPGVTHVCYQAPTEENIYARFKAQGATAVSRGEAPISLLGRGVCYAYERDADGVMFETEHLDSPQFEGPIWLSHVALVSPDIDRLVSFYQGLFGFEPNRRTNKAAGPTFDDVADYDSVHIRAAWFDLSNMTLELWQFVNPVTPAPGAPLPFEKIGYNKVAFEVSNIERDYRRLSDSGVQFLSEPVQTAESNEVYGRDPDGNLFSLIQPAPDSSGSIDTLRKKDW